MTSTNQYKQEIPWPEKPVCQISVDGVKACLLRDGRVMGWTNGFGGPEEVGRLTFADSGKAWIPKRKKFNSLVRQMFREGDFDGLLSFRRNRKKRQASMKAGAQDLYRALERIVSHIEGSGVVNRADVELAKLAMAKARGES